MFNIFIRLMEAKNGNLEITGQLFNPEIDAEECAKKESNKDYDPLKKFLGAKDEKVSVTIKTANQNPQKIAAKNLSLHPVESKSFTLEIPLVEKSEISFSHAPEFRHALSHINPDFKSAFWVAKDEVTNKKYFVTLRNQKLYIKRYKKSAHIRKELKYLAALAIKGNMFAKKCAIIRALYWLTKSHYSKKPIWLFEDKIYKGGDNGEYLYDYARQQKDGIKKYYVLNKTSLDAKRFKREGKPYVKYCSFRHKFIYLNADIVFNTHNGSAVHHSFSSNVDPYFRDLFTAKNVCIQHGLSVQNIPNLVNRINDNLQAFFLASPVEYKNLLGPGYAWKGYEDRLFLTGCPRYDGLKSHDKRVILITPTWRNYLAVPVATINSARARSADFKNTDYFKIYNSLINDPKLLQAAKEYNYKIVYLLHPVTASQINDFDRNDQVELIASTADFNYEKALTESSLMVTDYSGVQFDFAFQNKPIIYYHPEKLPPSYDEGAYKYQTMAFGNIVKTQDKLIDELISAMKNNCKQPKKYQARVEKFFAYTNRKNCQRIYKTIIRKFY